ncbi:hypothetical protein LRD69_24605 [Streptomyces sp. JH14]|uniref:hypothetical protein n=1 Tax=Streptomyces sp. JH14 TaxID=2793630 RepID=UPI0023F70A94|nr:hypothetical protein [Streptomyces sp. JH14]MDF6045271.1 hypothetical protein [Streptomyces sp. JH14]
MVRRWVPALALGGMWWWAVLRLVLESEHAGLVEGAVAAGGWGLSLLPVHVAANAGPEETKDADGETPGWCAAVRRRAGRAAGTAADQAWRTTRAWLRRRSGGGSGRS